MSFRITFIGAGSLTFTRTLLADLLAVPELSDIDVVFHDIDERNLDMVTQVCQRDIDANGLNIKIKSTLDRKESLVGAKYVINTARIGGLEAFEQDVMIPMAYGIDQCVGDTLCAGGIMYGQRGISAILEFCEDIKKYAAPGAIMLNYGNPNAMVTWAANKYGGVYTLGLCHGVQGGHAQIASALGIPANELDYSCVGINHQTWYVKLSHKGEDMTGKVLEAYEKNENLSQTEKVRIDMLKQFGYYSTESNGHLSEYVAWYRKRPDEIKDWIKLGSWIDGESGGYYRVCHENREWFIEEFPKLLEEEPRKYGSRSSEHGSFIIEGLELGHCYRGHFNVMNNGTITNLPDECIVEVPCYADINGISVPKYGDLPLGCAAVCSQSIWVQRLAVEAAVSADIKLLRQALMMDPLTGAVLNTAEINQLADEMLISCEEWLPLWVKNGEMARAKQRIADAKANGTYIPTNMGYKGACPFIKE